MMRKTHTVQSRLFFFDNLRYLMVLLVLVFHAGASYGSAVAFWPFHEANPLELIDLVMFLLDVFMMSVLFFIAGYFVLPSLRRRGAWRFIKGKLQQLGLPWVVVTVLVLPVLDYIHYYAKSVESGLPIRGYGTHWLLSMAKIAEFRVGWMNMSTYLDMTDHFYQRYVWFLSLLLLFFAVFALFWKVRRRWGHVPAQHAKKETASNSSIRVALTLTALLTILLFALVKFLVSPSILDKGWFSLGNLIQFQPGKLVFYASYFGLGVYAYSRQWFTNQADFGPTWVWGLLSLSLFMATMLVSRDLSGAAEPPLGLRLAFVVLYPIWTLSFVGLFTAFAVRHWNSPRSLDRELVSNSYNMYLVHYVFPMTLPLLLRAWVGVPVLVKFGVVALATVVLSYGISRFVIKPFSRFVVIGLVGLTVLLAVIA